MTATASSHPATRGRTFTLEEASALLPQLTLLLPRIQEGYRRLLDAMGRPRGPISHAAVQQAVAEQPDLAPVLNRLAALLHQLEDLGVLFQGPELGLVDFPAFQGDKPVLLCWQYGEPRIEWYHEVDAGFAGRRRLPDLPAPRYN